MSNDLIVKANSVIEASYYLSTVEHRLILSALAQIPKGVPVSDEVVYFVTLKDFVELGSHPSNAGRDLNDAITKLFKREISFREDGFDVSTRWIQQKVIKHEDSSSIVGIRFSTPLLPFLSNLTSDFTQYPKRDIAGVNSAYTIRIYEMICQYRKVGKRVIPIKDLRKMLVLGDKYKNAADLKRRIIDSAIEEINEKSPMNVKCEMKKTGRKYTHVELTFKRDKSENNTKEANLSNAIENAKIGKPSWIEKGLSDKQITKIGCNIKEFVNANSSKISPTDRRDYQPIFEDWKAQLKDPKTVNTFKMVQELLDRPRSA